VEEKKSSLTEKPADAVEGEPGPAVATTPRKRDEAARRQGVTNERTKAMLRTVRHKSQG
jgi:hypothetical protein